MEGLGAGAWGAGCGVARAPRCVWAYLTTCFLTVPSAMRTMLLRGGWLMGGEAEGLWPCELRVYNAAGRVVASVGGWRGEAVDLGGLPKGVYVARVGGYSAKFSK